MSVWLCSIVVALNVIWFISQLCQLYQKKLKANVPLPYLYFNIMSATEQLNLCHFYSGMVAEKAQSDFLAQKSRDWMHLFQVTTAWMILSFVLWLGGVCYASGSFRQKGKILVIGVLAELLALLPVIRGKLDRDMGETIFSVFHLPFFMNPAATCAVYYALTIRKVPMKPGSTSALSLVGFASQAVAHVLLAIWWFVLVGFPCNALFSAPWPNLWAWYILFGWASVDNATFAVMQGMLFWIAFKERKKVAAGGFQMKGQAEGKEGPLLRFS